MTAKRWGSFYVEHEPCPAPVCPQPGEDGYLVEQSHKEDCDINRIMAKFSADDLAAHALEHGGEYGDFSGAVDFHTALNQVKAAQEMFMTLPSKLREQFNNDVGDFLSWEESATEEDKREMGLLPPVPVAPPSEAGVLASEGPEAPSTDPAA